MSQTRFCGLPLPNLRAWRAYAGLGQTELAKLAGISALRLNRIESENCVVRFETIGKLADALQISRQALIHEMPKEQIGA